MKNIRNDLSSFIFKLLAASYDAFPKIAKSNLKLCDDGTNDNIDELTEEEWILQ